ncbi:helix-turn-helix domain-containing protein [Pelosinus sp. UFO1]|uniref:helix-turn-helix domain-containing protein n=1 Tax=Pelosinus sp. UFO1 TaxID=484770 RepID=UPI0004D12643|nr:transcriptional regulator [Pelosinus sp. UFO1]AIF51985.1 hypothetical protein UFO1_2438 [Pelosinus sp. UFO1]
MECRNRLEYWRLQLAAKRGKGINQKEMAIYLGVERTIYNKWERHVNEPTRDHIWDCWNKLKHDFPEINLQDLLEDAPI